MASSELINTIFKSKINAVGKNNWTLSVQLKNESVISGKVIESFISSSHNDSKICLLTENGHRISIYLNNIKTIL